MFGMGWRELLIILAVVILIFGTKRVAQLGQDMGGAIRGFRQGFKDMKQAEKEIHEDLH